MELIADKLKNIVKAGTHGFIYKMDILEIEEDSGFAGPGDKKG